MLGNIQWYSPSRRKMVRIGVNGGKVCYDVWEHGFKEVPEHLRQAVLHANTKFMEDLETIFTDDAQVESVR